MIDLKDERDMLNKFSELKIRQVYGAITIHDHLGNDLALIHKDKEAYAEYNPKIRNMIPAPNHHKFNDVVKSIQQKIKGEQK